MIYRKFTPEQIRRHIDEIRQEQIRRYEGHIDAFRGVSAHKRESCKCCLEMRGRIAGLSDAIEEFGGRPDRKVEQEG